MNQTKTDGLTLHCHITKDIYTRYMRFHVFQRDRSALKWVLLCGLILIFSLCNFFTGSPFLGTIFLVLSLYLLTSRFLRFFVSLRRIIKEFELTDDGRLFYTLVFQEDRFQIKNEKETAEYPWKQVYRAYLLSDAVYLYMNPQNAFLIPFTEKTGASGQMIAEQLQARLTPAQLHTIR